MGFTSTGISQASPPPAPYVSSITSPPAGLTNDEAVPMAPTTAPTLGTRMGRDRASGAGMGEREEAGQQEDAGVRQGAGREYGAGHRDGAGQ